MNFRQSVLREFLCPVKSKMDEVYIALRVDFDPSELTAYHQMVRKPGSKGFTPQIIHAITTLEKYDDTKAELEDEFKYVTPVGETYCVQPYTIGIARFGLYDEEKRDMIIRQLERPEYMKLYVCNWAETTRGYQTMVEDVARESENFVTEDYVRKIWENELDPMALKNAKDTYIIDHTNPKEENYRTYNAARCDEFIDATKPISKKMWHHAVEHYYDRSVKDEMMLRESNMRACTQGSRLLHGLWHW